MPSPLPTQTPELAAQTHPTPLSSFFLCILRDCVASGLCVDPNLCLCIRLGPWGKHSRQYAIVCWPVSLYLNSSQSHREACRVFDEKVIMIQRRGNHELRPCLSLTADHLFTTRKHLQDHLRQDGVKEDHDVPKRCQIYDGSLDLSQSTWKSQEKKKRDFTLRNISSDCKQLNHHL